MGRSSSLFRRLGTAVVLSTGMLVLALAAGGRADVPAPVPATPAAVEYVEMTVLGVLPSETGGTVVLVDPTRTLVVPIGVGGTEAMIIALRQDAQQFERPLTHDLLDSALGELGATVTDVRVVELRTWVYIAQITIIQGDRTIVLDARASDAIAVALGHGLPIWFAQAVVDEGGIPMDEFLQEPAGTLEDAVPVSG